MTSKATLEDKELFYRQVLTLLQKHKIPSLIGGTYAVREYTNIKRETKDLDVYCKAGHYQTILGLFDQLKYKTKIIDVRWLARVSKGGSYVDFIFGTPQGQFMVDDSWFENTPQKNFWGVKVSLQTPEDLIWTKAYMHDRSRFEGSDITHLILKKGKSLNWKKLLGRMDPHWEILFG